MTKEPCYSGIVRLALLGHDATSVVEQLKCSRYTALRAVRLAKKSGELPPTIWSTHSRISSETSEGVLNDWAACQYREYEIALRNKLPLKYKIAPIIERARLRGDHRAVPYVERAQKLEAYKKSLIVEAPRLPTLAEQIGIRIGPVVVKYNNDHQTTIPRRNVITLSGGLAPVHA